MSRSWIILLARLETSLGVEMRLDGETFDRSFAIARRRASTEEICSSFGGSRSSTGGRADDAAAHDGAADACADRAAAPRCRRVRNCCCGRTRSRRACRVAEIATRVGARRSEELVARVRPGASPTRNFCARGAGGFHSNEHLLFQVTHGRRTPSTTTELTTGARARGMSRDHHPGARRSRPSVAGPVWPALEKGNQVTGKRAPRAKAGMVSKTSRRSRRAASRTMLARVASARGSGRSSAAAARGHGVQPHLVHVEAELARVVAPSSRGWSDAERVFRGGRRHHVTLRMDARTEHLGGGEVPVHHRLPHRTARRRPGWSSGTRPP